VFPDVGLHSTFRTGGAVLYALFGTTNVTGDTKLLTTLGKLQTDAERWPDTNATSRALAFVKVKNALSAAERAKQVAPDVSQEIDALLMPLLRLPSGNTGQEVETAEVLIRYLTLLLTTEQADTRFVWFHIKARLKSLKAKNEMTHYTSLLRKTQALPLQAREKRELDELANEQHL